jgi:4-hydroxy-tetrahydrodipicolinate synthase
VLAPVLTPFGADLAPDPVRLVRHCRWLLAHGCSALAPFGTTSEANSLSVEERERLLDALVGGGIPPARLMPGTGCCAVPDSARLTAHAVRRGCAGVLMLPPFYYKGVSDDGLFRGFAEVIERVGDPALRVYLYHIPPVAQVGIGPALVERLLRAYPGTIAGMKDSSGDLANTRTMLDRFAKDGFDVFVGSEKLLLANLRGGGVGCITATGNVNASAIDRLFREWRSPEAEKLQEDVNAIRGAIEKVPVIPGLKAIVAHHADDPSWATVRPPLVPLAPAARDVLLAELAALRFEMPGIRA